MRHVSRVRTRRCACVVDDGCCSGLRRHAGALRWGVWLFDGGEEGRRSACG